MSLPTPLRTERTEPEATDFAGVTVIKVLRMALETLSQRVMLWVVTLGAGGVWLYTILHPDLLRLITAVGYSLTVLWAFLFFDRRGGSE